MALTELSQRRQAMPSHDPIPRNGVSHGGQEDTSALPGPLRHFADRLEEVRSAKILDMDQVGRLLVELADDEEFFGPLITQIPSGSPGSRWLIRPERGPGWCLSTVRKEP
jgi:hypothetical protein